MKLIKKIVFLPLSDYPIDIKANGNGIIYSMCDYDGRPLELLASVGMLENSSLA
jgi:hypothetical protein